MSVNKVKKRLFLGFSLGALLLAGGLIFGFWYLSAKHGAAVLGKSLAVAGWISVLLVASGLAGIVMMSISLFSSRSLGIFGRFAFRMLDFVYPFALGLSKALHVNTDLVRGSYVEVHNQATRFGLKGRNIDKIMILAPHCLQKSDCQHKITIDIGNCKRCGQCPVNRLIALADKFDVRLAVATGGTLARDAVVKYRPEAVVAIACERDLISGIQDVTPLPVIGVLNERPNGPCHNTQVDLGEIERVLRNLIAKPAVGAPREESLTHNAD